MRLVLLIVATIALGGCAGVDQDVSHLQQEQDAISAAIKKIKVVARRQRQGQSAVHRAWTGRGLLLQPSEFDRRPGYPRRRTQSGGVSRVWRPGRCDREHQRMVRPR